MTEHPSRDKPVFEPDDDRLLAYVLGLQDDPELEGAETDDDDLGRRLAALRDEMSVVADHVARAVPDTDETYSDVSQPRWDGLRPYVTGRPVQAGRRASKKPDGHRWLRVLAPAAAVVIAVAVGLIALQQQNGSVTSVGDKAAPELAAPGRSSTAGGPSAGVLDVQAVKQYAVVLIARAREVQGGVQRFDVVRVLRGAAPAQVLLRVETGPAEMGRLHVLYLSPRDFVVGEESPSASASPVGSQSPYASASPSSDESLFPSPDASPGVDELLFGDDGSTALVVRLPAGMEPSDISLP